MRKKMVTKVLAFAMAALMMTGCLAGCGDSDKKTQDQAAAGKMRLQIPD
ncbi:hypothetical protein MCG44_14430 [Lawsonibacter sp. OA9]|nr:hypothetical protein [Lawsonibacter sp. OA9]MCH1980915.1 hypothetical protein [Lawsonibacter sp. OA9]